jgi:Toprim domain
VPTVRLSHLSVDRAKAIWRETSPLGREAITYFANRCIDINQVPEHGGLRFHPRCEWPGNITKPCIIGRFTTALSNEPRGILRRPITGEKAIALGPMGGCVIRLWPDEAVEQGLVIGEGVETVLSAATRIWHRGTLLQPAWAVCVANNLKNFPIVPGIEALTVLVDNDRPDRHDRRAGQDAAAECAARWSAAGREVIRLRPKALGADFNDVVLRHES